MRPQHAPRATLNPPPWPPDDTEESVVGLEGFDERLIEATRRKGMDPDDVALLPDGSGWLLEARVWPTLEVVVVQSPAHVQRRMDEEAGLPLIRL